MAILAECPRCQRKQAVSNKSCKCGINLDNEKKNKQVKYHVVYRDNGKQKWLSLASVEGCKEYSIEDARTVEGTFKKARKENRLDIFDIKPETTMTFEELSEWWLNQDSIKSRSDFGRLKEAFKKFNLVFGHRLIKNVKLSQLKNYQSNMKEKGFANSTIDHETHSAARAAVKALWLDNGLSQETWHTWENFKRLISGKKAKKQYARTRVLELEEYCRLTPALPHHIKTLVEMNLFTGMRKSELVPQKNNGKHTPGLLWSQINLKDKIIHLTDTKTDDFRDIPITKVIEAILKKIPRTLGCDNVFTYRGKPFSDFINGLKPACEEAGIIYGKKKDGGFIFGDLRRTAKTLMARAGIDKAYRDAILGHESEDMDRHYLHPNFDKDIRKAMSEYTSWLEGEISSVRQNVRQIANDAN